MRFFIDADLLIKLLIFSLAAIVIAIIFILIALIRKKAYASLILWTKDLLIIWVTSIWIFGCLPIALAAVVWISLFFLLKYFIFRKDINKLYCFSEIDAGKDILLTSFPKCLKSMFEGSKPNARCPKEELKEYFSFWHDYSLTLIAVGVCYLLGIVRLYPEDGISFTIGVYLVAIAILIPLIRLIYALLNQPGNFFEKGVYSYIFIIVFAAVYFTVITLFMNNLGYLSF